MAPSVYSIIQVVPDPARGERLNVGAIVVNDELGFAAARIRPKTRQLGVLAPDLHHGFLADLERDLAATLEGHGAQLALDTPGPVPSANDLIRTWRSSANVVQYTEPAASNLPPSELLNWALHRFVETKPKRRPRRYHDKGQIKRRIVREFRLRGLADRLSKDFVLEGTRARCVFDYGIRLNGGDQSRAIQAISLEAPDAVVSAAARKDLLAFAFEAEEARNQLPVTLIAQMGSGKTRLERDAHAIVEDLGIELVAAEELPDWASDLAQSIVTP